MMKSYDYRHGFPETDLHSWLDRIHIKATVEKNIPGMPLQPILLSQVLQKSSSTEGRLVDIFMVFHGYGRQSGMENMAHVCP